MAKALGVSVVPHRSVVAGEQYERVFGQLRGIERCENLSNGIIDHCHKVAVHVVGAALKLFGGQPRRVWCWQRNIKKERSLFAAPRANVVHRFRCEPRQHFHVFEVRRDWPAPPELALNFAPSFRVARTNRARRRKHCFAAANIIVRHDVQRVGHAEIKIEPVIRWPADERFGVVVIRPVIKAEMPFADHRRGVAQFPQGGGNGGAAFFNYRLPSPIEICPVRITPRQQAVPCGHTYRGR